jgi:hypothetical protein
MAVSNYDVTVILASNIGDFDRNATNSPAMHTQAVLRAGRGRRRHKEEKKRSFGTDKELDLPPHPSQWLNVAAV